MTKDTQTTRRAMFAVTGAIATAAAFPAIGSESPRGHLLPWWGRLKAQRDVINATVNGTDEDMNAAVDRWHAGTGRLLRAPIRCTADAAAKLECAALMFDMGERTDKLDVAAIHEVAAYLRGRAHECA